MEFDEKIQSTHYMTLFFLMEGVRYFIVCLKKIQQQVVSNGIKLYLSINSKSSQHA